MHAAADAMPANVANIDDAYASRKRIHNQGFPMTAIYPQSLKEEFIRCVRISCGDAN